MIFSIVALILVGAIAYFQYVQGFFTATISAILAVVAAVLAFAYHEPLVAALLAGRMADQAHAMALIILFAGIYILLRVLFDKAVPGNIRLPVTADRVGAALMGLVAGIFAVGIVAIAAQALPFGPSLAMYARYTTVDRDVLIPGIAGQRARDTRVFDELRSAEINPARYNPADQTGLWIPVDDAVVAMVAHLSDGGSLAGRQPLEAIHPDYLDQLFGQRLGVQVGAKRVAINTDDTRHVDVTNLYELTEVQQFDSEFSEVRPGKEPMVKAGSIIKPDAEYLLLVVRMQVSPDATDTDFRFRFSPASARLVAGGQNHYPIGTMETARAMFVHRMDDPIIIESGRSGADLVYLLPRSAVAAGSKPGQRDPAQVERGVFLEVKRMARVSLAGKSIESGYAPDEKFAVIRKPVPGPKSGDAAAAPATPPILQIENVTAANQLFSPINVGTADPGGTVTLASGTATLREGRLLRLQINTTETIRRLATGDNVVAELFVPEGRTMVQVQARVPENTTDPWLWADTLTSFALVEPIGTRYLPNGAWARVVQQGQEKMVAVYDAENLISTLAREEGRPMEVWFVFNVPSGTQLREVQHEQRTLRKVDLTAP